MFLKYDTTIVTANIVYYVAAKSLYIEFLYVVYIVYKVPLF